MTGANHEYSEVDFLDVTDTSNPSAVTPGQIGDVRFVGDGHGYGTIQAAHDDLPNAGQGAVYVTEQYDSTNENYPIEWTTRAGLISNGVTHIGDKTNDTADTLAVNFNLADAEFTGNRPPGPWFENLQIVGGKNGVFVQSARFSSWRNVNVDGAANNGFRFNHDGTNANNSHTLVDCTSEQNGKNGISISNTSHAVTMHGCTSQLNGSKGLYVGKAYACNFIGGSIQNNDGYGIDAAAAHGLVVRDAYIEANAEVTGAADILIQDGTDSVSILNCYINVALGVNHDWACLVQGKKATFRDNYVNTHGTMSGFVKTYSTATDTEVAEHTNSDVAGNGVETIVGSDDGGTRTRSYGTIGAATGGVDLALNAGVYNGDVGHDDGTNTVGSGLLCTYDTTAGWQPSDGSVSF